MQYEWDKKDHLSRLYPPFALQVETWMIACWELESLNKKPYIFCGLRTHEEQKSLYVIGRRGIPGEKIVTKAPHGYSWHQYGLAIDIVADGDDKKPGLQPSWEVRDWYAEIDGVRRGIDIPIQWSGDWESKFRETCHFENKFGLTLARMRELWQDTIADPDLKMDLFYKKLDQEIALAA